MTSVPKIIRTARAERDLSLRQIKTNAEAAGHSLGLSTLQRYEKGTTATYSRPVLIAVAAGLDISPEKLLDAAGVPMLGEPFELPSEAALLEPHERDAVRSVVNAFIQNRQRQQRDSDEEFEVDKADRANVARRERAPHRSRRAGHDPEWDELYGDYELAAQEAIEDVDPGEVEEQHP